METDASQFLLPVTIIGPLHKFIAFVEAEISKLLVIWVTPVSKKILTSVITLPYIDTFLTLPLLTSSYIVANKVKRNRCKVSFVGVGSLKTELLE